MFLLFSCTTRRQLPPLAPAPRRAASPHPPPSLSLRLRFAPLRQSGSIFALLGGGGFDGYAASRLTARLRLRLPCGGWRLRRLCQARHFDG